ncbi:Heavy metal RND efflux outer membrane protein, CzcC family [hydrothermal vent metagenome]|uniref:Heavy metal RND efflux outer membrane protein, CzcC family n=1 Tax=hydrothermal vent metagenome TaxID=652676 RepID=A0A3B0ZFK8_9ZZZZ
MFFQLFYIKPNVVKTFLSTLLCISTVNISFAVQTANVLTLEDVEQIAINRDFVVKSFLDKSSALQQESIAIDTLPDPKLKFGFLNYPDDTFKQNQEPMTQKKIGIVQMFPKGDSLEIKSQRAIILSDKNQIQVIERKRKVRELSRKAWLEVYYWIHAKKILDENRLLFNDLVKITEGQYAAGKRRQVDYVQAQLELDLLNDKDFMFSEKEEIARAELAKWVGESYSKMTISNKLTELHENITVLNNAEQNKSSINKKLLEHPKILLSQNKVRFNRKNVELARQDYKPSWSLDLSYSDREGNNPNGSERANFVSAMVMVDIPLFTGNRQDKRVASKLKMVSASKNKLSDMLQVMYTKLEKSHTKLVWLKQRMDHYNKVLFPRAKQNSEAALVAYQSDRSDFLSLIKARIIEFKTQLQFLRLNVDHVSTEATLSYLLGDE